MSEQEEENEAPVASIPSTTVNNRPMNQNKGRKRGNSDIELIHVLKKRTASTENSQASDEADEDKMFLLSMLSVIRQILADRKLKLRADIINIVLEAKKELQTEFQQHEGYYDAGLSVQQSFQLPVMHPRYTQPTPMTHYQPLNRPPMNHFSNHRRPAPQPMRDFNTAIQSPPSTGSSIVSNPNEGSESDISEVLLFENY